ncbi:hypothetical protein TRL7639_01137 [Falsiruegeria litorea R37]|uniref:Uncharacterized protein n=1 Tax=Falsiruegeria litorea R37 TaxID=1200284 RepID=A0A1Y5RYS8_9RHOB|nr:hypothetical protein [Falsiruegeria litorea]SLN28807.1 hypothetical protein TRL7639_01137 [Falsiruegeria litorea R37]
MLETFLIALSTLGIVLFVQARIAAREIRRNRSSMTVQLKKDLVLPYRPVTQKR